MNLQYRIAERSDVPVIFEQAKNLIDTYEDVASIDYDKVLAWVRRKIEACLCEYRCVMADGEKCAYFRLCEDGEVDDLYVLPGFRNRSIGSEIVRKCVEDSPKTLWLYVFSQNKRAISFYERHGFSTCRAVGPTRLIMERKG